MQPRGQRIALRFDTFLLCGRTAHEAMGRGLVALVGTSFAANGASVVRSGRVRLEHARGRYRSGSGAAVRGGRRPAAHAQLSLGTVGLEAPGKAHPGGVAHHGAAILTIP